MKRIWLALLCLGAMVVPIMVNAAPWIWDNDGDGIDDRLEEVAENGYAWAFTNQDPILGKLRIQAARVANVTTFGAYVVYDHHPNNSDVLLLQLQGAQVTHTYQYFNVLRIVATYSQITLIRNLPGVVRIETIQALYPSLDVSVRGTRARDLL